MPWGGAGAAGALWGGCTGQFCSFAAQDTWFDTGYPWVSPCCAGLLQMLIPADEEWWCVKWVLARQYLECEDFKWKLSGVPWSFARQSKCALL